MHDSESDPVESVELSRRSFIAVSAAGVASSVLFQAPIPGFPSAAISERCE
jgi:hypothetical protein